MTKTEAIESFDPNGPGIAGNIFGLPFTPEQAELIIIPVPWEVTVSYRTGTAKGPDAIVQASSQIDLAIKEIPDAWKLGIAMQNITGNLQEESSKVRELAVKHIASLEAGENVTGDNLVTSKVNEHCENLNIFIKSTTLKLLRDKKMVALVGGDHSTPLGFLRALCEVHNRFAILQIDAHADLRKSYEGFTYSHASIMYNALKFPAIGRLVQVGIRDYCDEELALMKNAAGRIVTFFDQDLKDKMFEGQSWSQLCDKILENLPKDVYISFDIDGLNSTLGPNTGTPVPGGLEYEQVTFLIRKLVASGKRIIGFDLSEVAPGNNEWDANVGARLLYFLSNWMAVSQGKLKI
jgi:agmatinase